ncbi:ATP-binding cassette sub-family G member 4-like [Periplaneta americana]|uniref:ATP-binding cassette sub-family G member 4-like n=1 Tax=Periplaneta americana TaxID=6978 RepID=UPI0037E93739
MEQINVSDRELQMCQHHLDIAFRNLSFTVTTGRGRKAFHHSILKDVNGVFKAGRLTAIMGPSGAGKTTLLNVLSGFKTSGVSGSITINGEERNSFQFQKLSCYITQDFPMLSLLTTEETVTIAADLKLGTSVKKSKKKVMVNNILDILGLESVKHSLVKNLSGGEKKRLSIGCELLTNPPAMFFDEPTSGLDSVSSLQVISHLKSLAQSGRTVICSIHQPSSQLLEVFDDIYLLAGGQCLYSGPLDDMINVFKEVGFTCSMYYNRADFALEIASMKDHPGVEKLIGLTKFSSELQTSFSSNKMDETACKEETSLLYPALKINMEDTKIKIHKDQEDNSYQIYPASTGMQFLILTKRAMLCSFRDMYLTYTRLGTYLVVGLIFGVLTYNSGNDAAKVQTNIGFISFSGLFLFMLSPLLTVLIFPMEAAVFLREHHNNWYNLRAYYFSKSVIDLPLQVLCPLLFLIGSYFLADQPFEDCRALKFWSLCILASMCGQTMGFVTGAAFNAQLGLFVLIANKIPMMLFSGFYIRLEDVPYGLKWLTYVSYTRYIFEGGLVSLYGDNRPKLDCSKPYCHYRTPSKILEDFGMSDATYEGDMIAIGVWYISLQVMFYLVLKLRLYMSK